MTGNLIKRRLRGCPNKPPIRPAVQCLCRRVYLLGLLTPSVAAGFLLAASVVLAEGKAKLPPPEGARRLDEVKPVWVDEKKGRVLVDGRVTIRKGVLEMFACPIGTKEHESVVAVDSPAMLLHTALLAIGAEPGKPVQFDPEYQPPSGEEIDVRVEWIDENGERQGARAQSWVRQIDTEREMGLPFVFAGSAFWTDPQTRKRHYLAESGDLICVSNFGSAMLDVPAPSTQSNNELWFEPFTERIPPVDTPVRMILSIAKPAE